MSRRFRVRVVLVLSLMMASWQAVGQDGQKKIPAVDFEESDAAKGVDEKAKENKSEASTADTMSSKKQFGLLGPVRFGPNLSLGLPHPISWGLDVMYEDILKFSFGMGSFESERFDPVTIELSHWDARLHWHPWRGSFFLGLAYGVQQLDGEAKEGVSYSGNGVKVTVPVTVKVEFTTTYLTPHLGWSWIWDCGFNLGFDFGAQIPIANSSKLTVAFDGVTSSQEELVKQTDEYKKLEKDVDDAGDLIGETVLPYITLIRVGWLF